MELMTRIMDDLKQAMRDKNEIARDTLRMLKTDIGRRELEKGSDLTEEDVLAVLNRAVKTRLDSASQYAEAGRAELAEKERAEIEIIKGYLPEQLSEEDTLAALKEIAQELGLESKKQMGQLMKEINARYKGRVDGKTAAKLAGQVLG